MDQISVQDLKASLSATVAQAEAGRTLVITRHGQPVAQLGPAQLPNVHAGVHAGRGRIEPALKRATKGRYLSVLLEDRGSR